MSNKLKKVNVIAEMAWSHNGVLENALKIMRGAKKAGANAVGIHLTDMPTYMVESYKCLAGVTLSDTEQESSGDSIYSYLEKINLSQDEWMVINAAAVNEGIPLAVMCNDEASFEFSKKMNVSYYVISAACFLEFDFIKKIALHSNDIILRVGGATLNEIRRVVDLIVEVNANSSIVLLAGVQLYPTPIEELHLRSILSLQKIFPSKNISIGLADHIDGDDESAAILPCLALAYNISFIEKHITTDREEKLEDYEAALGIEQFANFIKKIRLSEKALGDGSLEYLTNDTYQKYRDVARKKIVASQFIHKGETLTVDNLAFKRSDYGCALELLNSVLGKKVLKAIPKDCGIELEDVS